MTDELFTVPESLSPREKWIRKHGVTTELDVSLDIASGETEYTATHPKAQRFENGTTTEFAIDELAIKLVQFGIPHWTTDPDCQ